MIPVQSQKPSKNRILDLETTNPLLDVYNNCVKNMNAANTFERWPSWQANRVRQEMVRRYAWAVPNDQAIQAIVERSPIIEIGAGRGYWAKLVAQEAGGDILAFDINPPNKEGRNYYHSEIGMFLPVTYGGVSKVRTYPDRTRLLCWPPYHREMGHKALKHHTGNCIIYIGEGDGGCTGDDGFHAHLTTHFEEVCVIDIPQWPCIHDHMWIYERKKKK